MYFDLDLQIPVATFSLEGLAGFDTVVLRCAVLVVGERYPLRLPGLVPYAAVAEVAGLEL